MFVKVINRKSHQQQKQTNFRDNTWLLLRGKCKTVVNKGLGDFVKTHAKGVVDSILHNSQNM